MGSAHREAFAALQWGLRDPNGFALIVGEPGTGKTSLAFALLEAQDEAIRIIHLSHARSFIEILDSITSELGIERSNVSATELARLIERKLKSLGTRLVLLFDEAQALDDFTFEQLRMFANNIVDRSSLMQIVLIAQPELLDRLKQPALRALDQRIATRAELLPLQPREVRKYVGHRLATCGGSVSRLFTKTALRSLVRNGVCIPREINLVCNSALILAYVDGSPKVTATMIREALRYYRGTRRSNAEWFRRGWKYLTALCLQIATATILVGAILSSTLLMPGRSVNLHKESVAAYPSTAASPVRSKSLSENNLALADWTRVAVPRTHPLDEIQDLFLSRNAIRESELKAPPSVVVKEGDTLSSLAVDNLGSDDRKAVQRLIKANPLLTDPNLIHPGQIVYLPSDSK